ncbi:MAG: peptidase, partial [Pseudomonadota bacterium]|nr:peptidase [Pseudomonadota bacterium]
MFNALKKPMASSTFICSLILVGCGGSGSSDSDVIASEDITWTQGVFEPSSKFDQQCQALNEKHWLRAWSHETYLWYDEIVDRDPALTEGVLNYFALLKTENTTDSGAKKDNF